MVSTGNNFVTLATLNLPMMIDDDDDDDQGRSDGGGYIGIYPPNQSTLKIYVVVLSP